jgi:hypothetical protein
MAIKKVSELTPAGALAGGDLVFISQDDGIGGFESKYVSGSEVKDYVNGIQYKLVKFTFKQSSTTAPIITSLVDELSLTLTTARNGVGDYEVNGFASNITGNYEISVNMNMISINQDLVTKVGTSSKLQVKTYTAGVLADDVADLVNLIITIKFY